MKRNEYFDHKHGCVQLKIPTKEQTTSQEICNNQWRLSGYGSALNKHPRKYYKPSEETLKRYRVPVDYYYIDINGEVTHERKEG